VGGFHGRLLKEMMDKERVPSLAIDVAGNTRENWIVKDKGNGKQYHFVMPGSAISDREWKECMSKLENLDDVEYIVLSGSMPAEYPEYLFESLAQIAYRKKARLIIDTKADALKKALDHSVYMIKPNQNEFLALMDLMQLKHKDLKGAARELISEGLCEVIVISLGAQGAILITANDYQEFRIPAIETNSVVGAGDSMVAGIIHHLVVQRPIESALAFGMACGSAATLNQGTELFHNNDVESLYKRILNQELENPVHLM
jgi:6-phosphofructokinase 2